MESAPQSNPKQTTLTTHMNPFIVNLMPFEKRILASVVSTDVEVQNILERQEADELRVVIGRVFDRWQPVRAVKKGLKTLVQELSRSPAQNFSLQLRESAYRSFFKSLETPWNSNKCRSQVAEFQNSNFRHDLLYTSDVLHFLQSVDVRIDEKEWNIWKILTAMMKRYPDDMHRWLFEVPGRLFYTEYQEAGFEVLNVVRMYLLRLVRPQSRVQLLQLCERDKNLGTRFWSRYQEEQFELLQKRSRFAAALGLADYFDGIGTIPKLDDLLKGASAQVSNDESAIVDGSEFNKPVLQRSSFLRTVLTYGHLDLLEPQNLRFISRDELINSLNTEKIPEQWLAQIAANTTDEEVKVAVLEDPIPEMCYQRLFFSEPEVFQRHLDNEELPLLTMERQMRVVLITDLPEDLLELKPTNFWKHWVPADIRAICLT